MTTLTECQPHFVRCVKPNAAGRPGCWEAGYVLEQLRAGGVLEAVRIAVAGAHPKPDPNPDHNPALLVAARAFEASCKELRDCVLTLF